MLNFVIALKPEAKPIIEHYKLQAVQPQGLFPIYQNEHYTLIISGVGISQASAATAYLNAAQQNQTCAWLNIGIAGHATHNIGDGFTAHKITEYTTGRNWYPPQTFCKDTNSDNLLTVDRVENDYAEDTLYDMEAAGFYNIAAQCNTTELVQCFKIISDNKQHSNKNINGKIAETLIKNQIDTISQLSEQLLSQNQLLLKIQTTPEIFTELTNRWHFTTTQQHQLQRLLQRWYVKNAETPIWSLNLESLNNSKQVIKTISDSLENQPVQF